MAHSPRQQVLDSVPLVVSQRIPFHDPSSVVSWLAFKPFGVN
jgi:hypothetical protein